MSPAEQWLRERCGSAPAELVDAMVAGLPDDGSDLGAALAGGALALYRDVVSREGGREDALTLLAADALFTHSFQAMAESNPESLSDFANRWGGTDLLGRLAGGLEAETT